MSNAVLLLTKTIKNVFVYLYNETHMLYVYIYLNCKWEMLPWEQNEIKYVYILKLK